MPNTVVGVAASLPGRTCPPEPPTLRLGPRHVQVRGNRGAALLLVVLLVSLLTVIVVEFQREASLETRAAANLRDVLQGHAFARSGAALGTALLLADSTKYDYREDDWTILNDLPIPVGDVTVELHVEDLDGKFPLGLLVDKQGKRQTTYVKAYEKFLDALNQHLKSMPDLEDSDILDQADPTALADALADWMDADESGEYEQYSDVDYTVPNAPLASLQELERIAGYNVTPEGYGHTVLEAILPYVDARSENQVNLNTADVPVLAAVHPQIDYDQAANWFDEITETPVEGEFRAGDYPSVSQITFSSAKYFKLVGESKRFRIRISIDVGFDVAYPAEAIVTRPAQGKRVDTVEWREGWIRPHWNHRAAPVSLPGGLDL